MTEDDITKSNVTASFIAGGTPWLINLTNNQVTACIWQGLNI
jgi:hypothetical protein